MGVDTNRHTRHYADRLQREQSKFATQRRATEVAGGITVGVPVVVATGTLLAGWTVAPAVTLLTWAAIAAYGTVKAVSQHRAAERSVAGMVRLFHDVSRGERGVA